MGDLLPVVLEVGEVNLKCMELLDRANTETFGNPKPTKVPLTVEKGPFIIITGHDLYDLKLLLEQTKDKGINVYTHGEMLPAHAYPLLKQYPHLKGNFGTAWQNQQKEFDGVPAPILYTTNCLMPVKESYRDRVFTTEVVSYPQMVHIGADKDFTPVIEKALELGGYKEDTEFTGINGGGTVMTGFGHGAVLGVADQVIEAVKSGAIRHFFLVGGCDGARPGRNYYTEFVKQTPADTVVLTLACGKYRFNDLDLGTIGGLPRLMDVGQCNDAYGAVKIALALAEAFGCGVNDLPLSMVLSWYEQKAVCILLTLLYLGIKNIRLGPTLPAFISPNVLNYLVEHFGRRLTLGIKHRLGKGKRVRIGHAMLLAQLVEDLLLLALLEHAVGRVGSDNVVRQLMSILGLSHESDIVVAAAHKDNSLVGMRLGNAVDGFEHHGHGVDIHVGRVVDNLAAVRGTRLILAKDQTLDLVLLVEGARHRIGVDVATKQHGDELALCKLQCHGNFLS